MKLDGLKSEFAFKTSAIRCLNEDCRKTTFAIALHKAAYRSQYSDIVWGDLVRDWRLLPTSYAKPQPDFIPAALRTDYEEACAIRDLSPKASATLSRRCLQGMIRDFSGIAKARLIDEIKELKRQIDEGNAPRGVDVESMDAIDAVRSIGNIGAHMEREIDLIVDVDPGEAQALIELIELLFEDWYVARHDRKQRLARVTAIADQKKAVIAAGKNLGLPVGSSGLAALGQSLPAPEDEKP